MKILAIVRMTSLCAGGLLLLGAPAVPAQTSAGAPAPGAAAAAAAEALAQHTLQAMAGDDACSQTAFLAGYASFLGLQEDLNLSMSDCVNLTDPDAAHACQVDALAAFDDGFQEVVAQFQARKQICSLLGGGPYDPVIDPRNFEQPAANPLFPFSTGTTWTYQQPSDEGLQVNVVTVTDQTKLIDGVECTGVHDTVAIDGAVIEDTMDFFAADQDGTVWYFGEISEDFTEGDIPNFDGSFLSGEGGAKPGVIMLAKPTVDTSYRQEYLVNEAEDVATVVSLDAHAHVPFGNFKHCLETAEFSALEPGIVEYKFYAPGIGVVLEDDPADGTQSVLVDFKPGN